MAASESRRSQEPAIFRVPQEIWDSIFAIIRTDSLFNNNLWIGPPATPPPHAQGRATLRSLRLTCHYLSETAAAAAFAEISLWTRPESLSMIVALSDSRLAKYVRKLEFMSTNVHSGFSYDHPQTGIRIFAHSRMDEELAAKFGRLLPYALGKFSSLAAIYTVYVDSEMLNLTRARMQDPMLAGLRGCMEKGVLLRLRKLHLHLIFISDFASLGLAKWFSAGEVRTECQALLGRLEELKIKTFDHTTTLQSMVRGDIADRGAWYALNHYNRPVQHLDRAFGCMSSLRSVALQFQYLTPLKLGEYPWSNLMFLVLRMAEFEAQEMATLLERCSRTLDTVALESCRLVSGSWKIIFDALAGCLKLKECYLWALEEPGMDVSEVALNEQLKAAVAALQEHLVAVSPKTPRIELEVGAIFLRVRPFKIYQAIGDASF